MFGQMAVVGGGVGLGFLGFAKAAFEAADFIFVVG